MATRYTIEAKTETGDWFAVGMETTIIEAEKTFDRLMARIETENQGKKLPITYLRLKETTDVFRRNFRIVTDFSDTVI